MAKAGRPSVYGSSARSVNLYLTDANMEYLERKAKEKGLASASAFLNNLLMVMRAREATRRNG